jgi:prepilin-type N-terminal cleavage/methylation domain-containing protein
MRIFPNVSDEDGFSLPELLVTIVLVGVTFVAILTGLVTSIKVSATHRAEATTDAVTRSAAEWVKDISHNPYGTTCSGTAMYSLSGLTMPADNPTASTTLTTYSARVTRVEYWDGAAPSATGTYDLSSHFSDTCPAGGDTGLQRITIVTTSSDGQATETVQVLKRKIA